MDNYYYLVPLTSCFGNFAMVILCWNRQNELNKILISIYTILIFTNLISIVMFFAENPESALFRLFVLRHFLFLLPFFLLQLSAYLTGRSKWNLENRLFLGFIVIAILLVDLTYFFNWNHLLIYEMKLRSWGYFPILKPSARILLSILFIGSWLLSLFWFIRPIREIDFFSYSKLRWFFLFWWTGLMLNMFPLSGYDIYPLGNGIDAIIGIAFSTYIHKRRLGFFKPGMLGKIAEVSISLSFGILLGYIFLSFMPGFNDKIIILVIVASGILSLFYLQYLKGVDSEKGEENKRAQKELQIPDLSKQENRICELILEGYRRSDLLVFLNISDGTLRNHLSSIYAKTINREGDKGEFRDQFQRLTVYLGKKYSIIT